MFISNLSHCKCTAVNKGMIKLKKGLPGRLEEPSVHFELSIALRFSTHSHCLSIWISLIQEQTTAILPGYRMAKVWQWEATGCRTDFIHLCHHLSIFCCCCLRPTVSQGFSLVLWSALLVWASVLMTPISEAKKIAVTRFFLCCLFWLGSQSMSENPFVFRTSPNHRQPQRHTASSGKDTELCLLGWLSLWKVSPFE